MSETKSIPPIDIVRSIYAAVEGGDLDKILTALAPNIIVEHSSALPFAGRWVGHDGFKSMAAAIFAAWPDFVVTAQHYFAEGDTVLVLTRVRGAIGSQTPLDQKMIERWRVRDHKAIECQPFYFDPVAAAATILSGD